MLVIFAVVEKYGAGETRIVAFHLVFQGGREAQVLEKVRVINIVVSAAVDDHHLGGGFAVYIGYGGGDGVAETMASR